MKINEVINSGLNNVLKRSTKGCVIEKQRQELRRKEGSTDLFTLI